MGRTYHMLQNGGTTFEPTNSIGWHKVFDQEKCNWQSFHEIHLDLKVLKQKITFDPHGSAVQ